MKKLPLYIMLVGLFGCGATVLVGHVHDERESGASAMIHESTLPKSMEAEHHKKNMEMSEMMNRDRYYYFVDEGMILRSDNQTNALYMLMPKEMVWAKMEIGVVENPSRKMKEKMMKLLKKAVDDD